MYSGTHVHSILEILCSNEVSQHTNHTGTLGKGEGRGEEGEGRRGGEGGRDCTLLYMIESKTALISSGS